MIHHFEQQVLNRYVGYVNSVATGVGRLLDRLREYYPRLQSEKKQRGIIPLTFANPYEPDEYTRSQALTRPTFAVGGGSAEVTPLNGQVIRQLDAAVEKLYLAEVALQEAAQSLQLFHALDLWQVESWEGAEERIMQIVTAWQGLAQTWEELVKQIEQQRAALLAQEKNNPYKELDELLRMFLLTEKEGLDSWGFHLNGEEVHGGWPLEKVRKQVAELQSLIPMFRRKKFEISYPADTVPGAFAEALENLLSEKQSAIEEYSRSFQQNDAISNGLYLRWIKHIGQGLLPFYDLFIQHAAPAYLGIGGCGYLPRLEWVHQAKKADEVPALGAGIDSVRCEWPPFAPQEKPLNQKEAEFFRTAVQFLNKVVVEGSQMRREMMGAQQLMAKMARVGYDQPLPKHTYDRQPFYVPTDWEAKLSFLGSFLPPSAGQVWGGVLPQLLAIMQEMKQRADWVAVQVHSQLAERHFDIGLELEKLDRLFGFLDTLVDAGYRMLRDLYASYPPLVSPWQVSGEVLGDLVEQYRRFLRNGGEESSPSAAEVASKAREALQQEFGLLKGLRRLGESNGLCPYSSFEAVAKTVWKALSEYASAEDRLRLYHQAVEQYAHFVGIAEVPLLPALRQFESFSPPSEERGYNGGDFYK